MKHSVVFTAQSAAERSGAAGTLAVQGRVRLPAFLDPGSCEALWEAAAGADWRHLTGADWDLDAADLDEPDFAAALDKALAEIGAGPLAGPLQLGRHRAGQFGVPPVEGGGVGLILDLNAGWRSEQGGLLLFLDPQGRAQGWRPEAGALCLYDTGRAPLITMVAEIATEPRLSVFGRVAPAA